MVLESSKEAATNARELSEKSEAAREDPGMIAALLGCGILYKFGLKLMPQEKRDQFKAWKKKKRKEFEKWKKNNKTKVQMWQTVGLLAGGLFTYSDLATDILAIQSLYSSGEDGWALAMVCTLIFPSILAMGGILKYVYDNHIEYFRCGNWYYIFALPFFHAGLDFTMPSLMIIDLVFKTNWGKRKARGWKVRNTELNTILGEFSMFLDAYKAVRTVTEAAFEAFPQVLIQYIYATRKDGYNFQVMLSLFVSVFNIVLQVIMVFLSSINSGKSMKNTIKDLVSLGGGLPTATLEGNKQKRLVIPHRLNKYQIKAFCKLLEANTSVEELDLTIAGLKDEGCALLADVIKKRRENTVKDQAFPLRKLVLNWSTLPGKEGTKKLAVEWHKNIEELMKVEPEDKLALSTRSSASNDSLDDSLGASTRSFEDMADTTILLEPLVWSEVKLAFPGTADLIAEGHPVVPEELVYERILTSDELVALAKGMEQNKTVKVLNLPSNTKNDKAGVQHLAAMVEKNVTLKQLHLHNMRLENSDATLFGHSLSQIEQMKKKNVAHALELLDLDYTDIRPIKEGFEKLLMSNHPTLPDTLDYCEAKAKTEAMKRQERRVSYCCGILSAPHKSNNLKVHPGGGRAKSVKSQHKLKPEEMVHLARGLGSVEDHSVSKLILPYKECTSDAVLTTLAKQMIAINKTLEVRWQDNDSLSRLDRREMNEANLADDVGPGTFRQWHEFPLSNGFAAMLKTNQEKTLPSELLYNLREKTLTEADVRFIFEGLKTNTTVKRIDLTTSKLTNAMLNSIADALKPGGVGAMRTNQNISVVAKWNEIEPLGGGFAQFLMTNQANSVPQKLSFSRTLGQDEIMNLMQGVGKCHVLSEVDICKTPLTDKAAGMIAGALSANKKVKIVCEWDKIDTIGPGFEALLKCQQRVSLPTELGFARPVTENEMAYLTRGIAINRTIVSLDLTKSENISQQTAENIASMIHNAANDLSNHETKNWGNADELPTETEGNDKNDKAETTDVSNGHPVLRTLALHWESFSPASVSNLIRVNQEILCPPKSQLDFSKLPEEEWTVAAARGLSEALQSNDYVMVVELNWDTIPIDAIGQLLLAGHDDFAYCKPTNLNLLTKGDVDVGESGIPGLYSAEELTHFAEGLSHNATLKECIAAINTDWEYFPIEGLGHIIAANHKAGPKRLNLSGRTIDQAAVKSLQNGLNPTQKTAGSTQAINTAMSTSSLEWLNLDWLRVEAPSTPLEEATTEKFFRSKHGSLTHYDEVSVELINLGWEKIRQMNVDLNKGGKFPWGTTILKEISLLLRTNDLRLPKFLDLSNRKSEKMWVRGKAEKEGEYRKLVKSFKTNTTVEELNMSSNKLDSDAIKILFEVLDQRDIFMKENKAQNNLKILNLANNDLGTKSAAEQVKEYVYTTKLDILDISTSTITKEARKILKQAKHITNEKFQLRINDKSSINHVGTRGYRIGASLENEKKDVREWQ
jgi:hypothetical protein